MCAEYIFWIFHRRDQNGICYQLFYMNTLQGLLPDSVHTLTKQFKNSGPEKPII